MSVVQPKMSNGDRISKLHRELADYHAAVAAAVSEPLAVEYHVTFAASLRDYAERLDGIKPVYSA